MTFTNLPAMANYIKRNHYAFGGDSGCGWIGNTLSVLGRMNAAMNACKALVGMTFVAWQDVPGYGDLKTYITISKTDCGAWVLTESTIEPA